MKSKLLKQTLCAAALSLCAAAHAALSDYTPTHWYQFNGNLDSSGSTALTYTDGGMDATYEDTQNDGNALVISSTVAPRWTAMACASDRAAAYSFVCSGKMSSTSGAPLWSLGSIWYNNYGGVAIAVVSGGDSTVYFKAGFRGTNGNWPTGTNLRQIAATVPDATSRFHTYAIVKSAASSADDDATFTCYVDGVSVGSFSIGFLINNPVMFGGVYDKTGDANIIADGAAIDDWRMYTGELTAAEIAEYAEAFPVYPAYGALVWNGASDSDAWTTSSSCWTNNTGTSMTYANTYAARFDDAATYKTVSIGEAVTPLSVTVDNSSGNDYTFTGSTITPQNGILTKQGAGTLNIPNNMVGGTVSIEDGKVNMSYSASTSSTKVTFADDSELSVSGNGYVLGADVTVNSDVTATITPSDSGKTYYIGTSHNVVNNGTIAITGGSGTIAFTGTYSGSGNVTVSGGNLFLTNMTGLNLAQATDSGSIYIGNSSSATLTNPNCDIAKISLWGDGTGSTLNVSGGTFKTSDLALGTTTKVTAENVEMEIGSLSGGGSLNAELKTGGSFKFTSAIDMSSKVTAIDATAISSSEKTVVLLTAPSTSTFDTSKITISSAMTTEGYSIKLVTNDDGTKSIVATKGEIIVGIQAKITLSASSFADAQSETNGWTIALSSERTNTGQSANYFKLILAEESGAYYVSYALDESVVTPTLNTAGAFGVSGTEASFAVDNIKRGLWYSVVSSDDVTAENYDYPTTEQKTNAGKQATTTDNLSLSIPLPDSNVQFYKIAVDDVEPTWR